MDKQVPGLTVCPRKRPEKAVVERDSNRTMVRRTKSQACRREVAESKNRRTEKMKKTQPEGSELKRGWPSKKVKAGRSGKVFSLDFLFIEQLRSVERMNRVSYRGSAVARSYVILKSAVHRGI